MKSKILTLFRCLLVSAVVCSCGKEKKAHEQNELGDISLSPDDSELVFSYFQKGVSKLCKGGVDGDSVKILLSATCDSVYAKPTFSPDGNRIMFLASPVNGKLSNIFVMDKQGRNRKQITFQDEIITEAIFSVDGKHIFYIKAETFEQYSPLVRKAPHGMDIYRHTLKTNREQRITNFDAYAISAMSTALRGKYLSVRLITEKQKGIYLIDIGRLGKIQQIIPANRPRAEVADLYDDPTYSDLSDKLIFTAPYEIYSMDMKTKLAQLLYSSGGNVFNVIAFNKKERILFINAPGGTHFKSVNFDGTQETQHALHLPETVDDL